MVSILNYLLTLLKSIGSLLIPVLVVNTINENFARTALPSTIINRNPYINTLINLSTIKLVSLLLFLSLGIVWNISHVDLQIKLFLE